MAASRPEAERRRERRADTDRDDRRRHDRDPAGRRLARPAEHVAGTGITVNNVLPGPTRSRGVGDFIDDLARASGKNAEQVEADFFERVRPTSLIKRLGSPQEVASLVAYVASPIASATTGAALRVDGGGVA